MTISVIIPFYNLAGYVRETLDSVIAAASRAMDVMLEVICIDDGSTDDTGVILDAYSKNNGFRVIHKTNGGEGSARNAGLAVATGEWVTYLDGDDVWLSSVLTEFSQQVERHPEADIIGFKFISFKDGENVPEVQVAKRTELVYDVCAVIPSAAVLDLGVFPTFFRREKYKGIAFSALPLGADRLYVAECLAIADTIVLSPIGVLGYRVRAGSMARVAWDTRKIKSMIDYAYGSLHALANSGKVMDRRGVRYLTDVLLSVTPKYIHSMSEDAAEAMRYWHEALRHLDCRHLTLFQRLLRWWYCR